jgi:hypothetical protein
VQNWINFHKIGSEKVALIGVDVSGPQGKVRGSWHCRAAPPGLSFVTRMNFFDRKGTKGREEK